MNDYRLIRFIRDFLYVVAFLAPVAGIGMAFYASSNGWSNAWIWLVGGALGLLAYAAQAQFLALVLDIEARTTGIAVALNSLIGQSPAASPAKTAPGPVQVAVPSPQGAPRTSRSKRSSSGRPFADMKSGAASSGHWACLQCSAQNPSAVSS